MKKVLAITAILCMLLVGCGKPGKGSESSSAPSDSSTVAVSSVDSSVVSGDVSSEISSADSQQAEETSSQEQSVSSSKPVSTSSKASSSKATSSKASTSSTASKPTSSYPTYTEGDMEYIRFSAFEKSTQAQLDTMLNSNFSKVTISKDKAHYAKGATSAIKLEYRKLGGWAQLLDMKKSANGAGAKLVDPFPMTLGDYEGIRFWLEVAPQQGGGFTTMRVIVGDWGYGYRTMYQKDVTIPKQGFKGYIEIPFDELADAYGSPNSADPDNMDFIGFNFSAGSDGCQDNVDIYISDVQAYRSL